MKGVTIFPILFSTIVGRTLGLVAAWSLERGVKLRFLEQLLGSATIFRTFETQYILRTFNLFGFALALLWAMSPIGAQATLRVISTGYVAASSNRSVGYFGTNASAASEFDDGRSATEAVPLMNSMYMTTLISPDFMKQSYSDIWGNVKIPTIESLNSSADPDGWMAVPSSNVSFSSLLGIPMNVSAQGNSTLVLQSSYFSLQCDDPVKISPDQEVRWQELPVEQLNNFALCQNAKNLGSQRWVNDSSNNSYYVSTFSIGSLLNNSRYWVEYPSGGSWSNATLNPPRQILFQTAHNKGLNISAINCTVRFPTVQSEVYCLSNNCSVLRMRRVAPSDSVPPDAYTPLEVCQLAQVFYKYFAVIPVELTPINLHDCESMTEGYLAYGKYPGSCMGDPGTYGLDVFAYADSKIFAERLGRLMTTFWMTGFLSLGGVLSGADLTPHYSGTIVHTSSLVTTQTEKYICNDVWLFVLIISSSVLVICAVGGTVLSFLAIGPELLGYTSSLIKDNPYVPLEKTGSTMSGSERARLLGDMRLKLGDVQPDSDVGYIAISVDGSEVGALQKGRLYA